jgi:hypothetical protein
MDRKHSVPKEKSQNGETLSFAHLKILSLLSILEAGGEDLRITKWFLKK